MTLPEPFATTEAFKDRIRACRTAADVAAEVEAMAAAAKAHEAHDPGGIAQLRHLITYQRMSIAKGWLSDSKHEAAA